MSAQSLPAPTAAAERPQSRLTPRRALWALIGLSTALRFALAACLPAVIDESYYFQYDLHLDWAYFDHPPMVALVGLPGLWLSGDAFSLWGLRLGFIALFAGSTWLMARLATRYFDPWSGVLAALALNVSGYFGLAVGTTALPDGPLLFFWLLTLDRLADALERPERIGCWLGVGAAWGGAMLSKYHAVLLPAGALLFLVLRPHARACLRKPGPYLAVAVGAALFSPVIWWNATHGWASFLFQGGRASGSKGLRPEQLASALGAEALYLFPWLWLALVVILFRLLRRGPRTWTTGETFLICQAVPALVLFHAVASIQRIMPYWPLFGFISLMPLLGRDWEACWRINPIVQRRWLALMTAVPILLAAGFTAHARLGLFADARGRLLGVIPARSDPSVDQICWDQVADELGRRGLLDEPGTFLFADSWDRSAKLALATRGRVPVACYNLEARSYSFWSRPDDWIGRDGVFVEVDQTPGRRSNYSKFFRSYDPIGSVRVVRAGACVRELWLHRGTYQTWGFPFDSRLRDGPRRPQVAERAVSARVLR